MVQCHILFEIRRRGNPTMQQVADIGLLEAMTFPEGLAFEFTPRL